MNPLEISSNYPQDPSSARPISKESSFTDKKVQMQRIKIEAHFREILEDIKKNKENLSPQNYRIAVQTVKGIAKLAAKQGEFKRETLTNDIHQLTGMSIHAAENYPTTERFADGIALAVRVLQQAYGNAQTDSAKLNFFKHALDAGGCFEFRVEALCSYLEETETLAGQLKYAIMDLNTLNNRPKYDPVKLEDLIVFLHDHRFFEQHDLDESSFKEHPVVAELRSKELIVSNLPKDPIVLIHEAFSNYEDYNKGEKAFLDYLSKTIKGYSTEQLNQLANRYFDQYPERKSWI